MFSGGIEKDKWHEIGYDSNHALSCLNEISKIQNVLNLNCHWKFLRITEAATGCVL